MMEHQKLEARPRNAESPKEPGLKERMRNAEVEISRLYDMARAEFEQTRRDLEYLAAELGVTLPPTRPAQSERY